MDVSDEEAVLMLLFNILGVLGLAATYLGSAKKTQRRRRRRRWGVHPLNRVRDTAGQHHHLYSELRNHPERFFTYTRMTIPQFDHLLSLLRPKLTKHSRRKPIDPAMRLIITLRYLADGETCTSLATSYRIGKSTAHDIINETTQIIWDNLRHIYLEPPTTSEYETIAEEFYNKWDMPNCVGSIDGKHIRIVCPPLSGSENFNHKTYFSIVLLASCDANYNFTHVTIGAKGSASDGGILRDCPFGQALYNNKLGFPLDAILPNTPHDSMKFPFFMAGDEAFPLKTNIMTPFSRRNLVNHKQRIFNYRLSRARRVIENCFGLLANRWRIFHTTIFANEQKAKNIVKACVVLHNFIQKTTEYYGGNERGVLSNEEDFDPGVIRNLFMRANRNARAEAVGIRDCLATYFVSPEGRREWQDDIVNRAG